MQTGDEEAEGKDGEQLGLDLLKGNWVDAVSALSGQAHKIKWMWRGGQGGPHQPLGRFFFVTSDYNFGPNLTKVIGGDIQVSCPQRSVCYLYTKSTTATSTRFNCF